MADHGAVEARSLLPFPAGDNSTDTVFGGVHFNLTTLTHWNYTYYGNGTLSNNTKCWLTYRPYQPALLLTNGTFVNATKCYSAVDPIGARGYTGIGFAVVYGVGLVLTLSVLAKHGKLYLPKEKRFFPIGRRWQWYWACFVCACALISLFVNVDVDRYHVQELPIVLTAFFWFLICQGTMALVWESVRHWGSWQERQFIDPNPFIYSTDDKRAMFEFWLPLWFYFWLWLNFFLVVPRSWKFAEQQRSPEQELAKAIPAATGARFKAAAFCLIVPWLTILVSLFHSIKHYRNRDNGVAPTGAAAKGLAKAVPLRFLLTIPLSLVLIAYQIYISFHWRFSIMKADGDVAAIYFWGYGPSLLIIFAQVMYGWASPNEDKALIQQRRQRGEVINRELGIVAKPAWWRRVRGEHLHSLRDKIANNVNEIGGGRRQRTDADVERQVRFNDDDDAQAVTGTGTGMRTRTGTTTADPSGGIEMRPMASGGVRSLQPAALPARYEGKSERRQAERVVEAFAGVIFPAGAGAGAGAETSSADAERARRIAEITKDGPPPPYSDEDRDGSSRARPATARRDTGTSSVDSTDTPPQIVRSMLDV
ncbi:Uncharacterized protein ESCO_006572 [Escovopsis weberi]|uniref:Uncharacterized protein n=1 Tax=Escovopsis weberi TaxID=150374 RepID=A0A0M9VXL7_ESCWE|nr:Uncharacterized protein ESCO_006572 [Escovopsis weberi]